MVEDQWNKPRVMFLSYKQQFAILALISRAQKLKLKEIELLDSDSPVLNEVADKIRPEVSKYFEENPIKKSKEQE